MSRKPPPAQKRKKEEEKIPSEESGDESPEPNQPSKKKKITKASSKRSTVKSTQKPSLSSPAAKFQAKDAESGNSSLNTETPQVNLFFDYLYLFLVMFPFL